MIPRPLIDAINEIRGDVATVVELLGESKSFQALAATTPPIQRALEDLLDVLVQGPLRNPCDGKVTCAFVGSSGHGKTTIMDEMFPGLSKRGWLVTDVTDTTAQSLKIQYAPPKSEALKSVRVHSWSIPQIKELMASQEVSDANAQDNIKVTYNERSLVIDGTEAQFEETDMEQFRFPKRVELHPFSQPYEVPEDKRTDKNFIRALTIKEQSQSLNPGSVLGVGKHSYNSLQLRALVKDVTLHDSYQRLKRWAEPKNAEEDISSLSFVDTPGLAVSGSIKDEVLKHFLEKKSHQIIAQLWKDDELDVVVHLVLCGRQSDFSQLWKFIERELGQGAMESLSERLILAINGMNIYFTNRDLKKRHADPEVARREGDHFATTIEDNILQKMSPHGRVKPARLCFVDSKNIVETLAGDYSRAYEDYKKQMKEWIKPEGVGFETLGQLGIQDSFHENIQALADPNDRGQGYLTGQIIDLIREKGPSLLVKKYLIRTKILSRTEAVLRAALKYYTIDGELNRAGIQEALKGCLAFLDHRDLNSIEQFAKESIDPFVPAMVPGEKDDADEAWVENAFGSLCKTVKAAIVEKSEASGASVGEFGKYFDDVTDRWSESWGYRLAEIPPPSQGYSGSSDLIRHSLQVHGREIIYQLLVEDQNPSGSQQYEQDRTDRDRMKNAIALLDNTRRMGTSICADYGVEA